MARSCRNKNTRKWQLVMVLLHLLRCCGVMNAVTSVGGEESGGLTGGWPGSVRAHACRVERRWRLGQTLFSIPAHAAAAPGVQSTGALLR